MPGAAGGWRHGCGHVRALPGWHSATATVLCRRVLSAGSDDIQGIGAAGHWAWFVLTLVLSYGVDTLTQMLVMCSRGHEHAECGLVVVQQRNMHGVLALCAVRCGAPTCLLHLRSRSKAQIVAVMRSLHSEVPLNPVHGAQHEAMLHLRLCKRVRRKRCCTDLPRS